MRRTPLLLLLLLPVLPGCDRLAERMGMPDPAKVQAESKAVGGACRHAGRGLEDCYRLNPDADKAAVYEGWKEMNEYMAKHNMQAVPPTLDQKAQPDAEAAGEQGSDKDNEAAAHGEGGADSGTPDAPEASPGKPAKADKRKHQDEAAGGH